MSANALSTDFLFIVFVIDSLEFLRKLFDIGMKLDKQ